MIPQVSLVLHHDPDSLKLLRAALAGSLRFHQAAKVTAEAQARMELERKQAMEAQRNERRAAEFDRRAALVQQLIDQLPDEMALNAPMG